MRHVGKRISKKGLKAIMEDGANYYWNKTQEQIKQKEENMSKTKKNKNRVIVVPTTKNNSQKPKIAKLLKTARTPASKSSTCAYYDCLKGLVALPENDRVKITSLTHKCKCSKKEIAEAKVEMKHKLVHELAKDYRNIGINLGKYMKADIVGCAKELKGK